MRAPCLALLTAVLLPGCAAFLDGTTQTVTVRTAPVGAACSLQRSGKVLVEIPATPATVLLHRERRYLTVVCQKPGWETTVATIPYGYTGDTAGNVVFGGLIGIVVDEATRANYRYDDDTIILMKPPVVHGLAPGPVATVIPPGRPAPAGAPARGFILSHSAILPDAG